ncbi:MAG TPA: caspase domain-containing protein [Beijerinckiaceae bacterium]|jgi:uncharacterized caspase-like protein
MLRRLAAAAFAVLASLAGTIFARAEPRLALVIGQGAYAAGELATAVNDAALVGQTLTSAGFEVIQGRDLNQADLRRIVRDFLDGVQTATPDASVVVYVAGHALQVEGEDYIIPADARIARESDIPIEGYRVSDIVRPLSAAPGAIRIVILDAAREYPLPASAQGIARGLAIMEPPPGFLVAFAAAPGTTARDGPGPYGPYATALVEMIREPGLVPNDLFARVRLRVHETTGGRQTPWHAASLNAPFAFFVPIDAPPPPRERRSASASPEEAYAFAVGEDTIPAYQEFLRIHPGHPLARRVKVLLAARREAVVWRRTILRNSPEAYWTYLRRYPRGPHAADARRRLSRLSVPLAPPPDFDEVVYRDVPPPLPVEIVEVRETIVFEDDLPPPPRAPVYLLPEREEAMMRLEAPPPAPARGILPIPIPIPIPIRARPPAEFRPPIAPITPQGPVTIPVMAPPSGASGRPGQVSPPPGQPGAPPQPGAVPGQPGLRARITPLVQQGQPGAAPGGPAATPPGASPGAAGPGAPAARPGAIVPGPGGPAASQPPGPRPGAIAPAPSGPPGAATPAPAPAPGAPAAAPAPRTGPAPSSPAAPGTGAVPRPGPGGPPPAARPSPPGGPAGQAPAAGQPPTAPAARPPGSPPGQAPAARPPGAGAPGPARPGAPGPGRPAPPRPSDPSLEGPRGPVPPGGPRPPRVQPPAEGAAPGQIRPRPAAPGASQGGAAPAVPRPAPPVAQPPRPAAPPAVTQPQRPAAPPPGASAPGAQPPRPAGPPSGAQPARPAGPPPGAQPRPQPSQGGQKCVLPNGQPCPPPR